MRVCKLCFKRSQNIKVGNHCNKLWELLNENTNLKRQKSNILYLTEWFKKKKKRNILTCQEFPSAVLKEKKRKKVRIQLWVKQKENQNTSIWQRLYTTERQKYCRMQKTCQKWHKTCSYCQHAQNDGLVCLSNHLLLPWPRMTQSIWHKPFAQRSSHPCAQMFSDLCKWLEHLPKKQQKKQNIT